jgi:hypothetical protein
MKLSYKFTVECPEPVHDENKWGLGTFNTLIKKAIEGLPIKLIFVETIADRASEVGVQPEVMQKIAEVVKPFAMAFDDLKATRLHPEDKAFQEFEDSNLVLPTKGLNSGHFRKIWELYNQLSNFSA